MWAAADLRRRLAGLLLAACPLLAGADPYHYVNLLVGDRAAGMGGAYVAVSDDPAGLYYNPAGIAYAQRSNLSASMNTYDFTQRRYRSVLGGRDWVRTSSSLLPNFFGVTQPLGPGVAGFSYAVPDSVLEDQRQSIPGVPTTLTSEAATYTIDFNNRDATYLAGPSYGIAIDERLSLGLTLYGYLRTQQIILNQQFTFSDPSLYHWENTYIDRVEYGLRPLLGLMFTPVPRLSLGLTLGKTQLLRASESTQTSCAGMDGASYPAGSLCQAGRLALVRSDQAIERRFPWTATLGGAYFPSPALLLSTQLSLYQDLEAGGLPLWNLAAGGEYYFNPRLALRLGTFTDNAVTPHLRRGVTDQAEHVDLYGASLSLTRFTRSSSLTLGASARAGRGEAQILAGQTAIQRLDLIAVTVFLSAAYSY